MSPTATVRRRARKPKGTKRVSYEMLPAETPTGEPIYRMLRDLVVGNHEHLKDARIALAWCTSWKPDVDGRVTLGKCVKASDLHREMAPFDFVILLKKSFWQDMEVTPEQRRALLDHELCHAGVRLDERTNEPVYDDRGRKVYRLVRHDVEEFSAIVERYGVWKRDLELFAQSLNRSARGPWVPCQSCQESDSPGWAKLPGNVTKRCGCWVAWQQRNTEAVAS